MIAAGRYGDDGRVDRVVGGGPSEQRPSLPSERFVHGDDVDSSQEPCESRLAAAIIAPYLGDHRAIAAQIEAIALRHAQLGENLAVVSVSGDQRAGVEDKRRHWRSGRNGQRREPQVSSGLSKLRRRQLAVLLLPFL